MHSIYLLFDVGPGEIIVILVVVLLLFGGKKIPELMRGLGSGIREFNDAKNNVKSEINKGVNEQPQQPAPQQKSEELPK